MILHTILTLKCEQKLCYNCSQALYSVVILSTLNVEDGRVGEGSPELSTVLHQGDPSFTLSPAVMRVLRMTTTLGIIVLFCPVQSNSPALAFAPRLR